MKSVENRDSIDKTAYGWPTDDPYSWGKVKTSWLMEEADRLRSQRLFTSSGAGSSNMAGFCEYKMLPTGPPALVEDAMCLLSR